MDPTNNPDFQHGYASGVAGVNRETYEGYLSSQVNQDWLTERLAEKRTKLTEIERYTTQITDATRTAYADLQNHALQAQRVDKQVKQREVDRLALEADRDALRRRRTNASPDYSLLAGLLFLVAGISFLAGDLIISHEIVAYALNIRDTNEAWAFAFGLAMVSILLKPAYDRLIEQPYLENPQQNRVAYERFKITLSLFSLLTLAVLGWFRYEAYRTDQLKAAINKSVRQLQLNTDLSGQPLAATQSLNALTLGKIEKQLGESSELNLALVNSPWAMLSFVLSGILFALAGAVCLGIALPVVSAFWFRWLQADPKLWKLRRRLKRLAKELAPLEAQLAEQRTRQTILQHDLDLLPVLDELHEQRRAMVAEINDLLADLKLAQTDSRISNFNDGYDQGEALRTMLNDDERRQLRREVLKTGSPMNGNQPAEQPHDAEKTANGKPQPSRVHQTVREFLPDDL